MQQIMSGIENKARNVLRHPTLEEHVRDAMNITVDKSVDFSRFYNDKDALMQAAALLYNCDGSDIDNVERDNFSESAALRYTVTFSNGEQRRFYTKKKGCIMAEALGLSLSNIMQPYTYTFIVNPRTRTILMNEVSGIMKPQPEEFVDLTSFAYGKEIQDAMNLKDRDPRNAVVSHDGYFVHIDFESVFSTDYDWDEIRFHCITYKDLIRTRQEIKPIVVDAITANYELIQNMIDYANHYVRFGLNPKRTIDNYIR